MLEVLLEKIQPAVSESGRAAEGDPDDSGRYRRRTYRHTSALATDGPKPISPA